MSIDEAITFCNEKAINIKLKAEPKVFIQLAERLEELKAYRENSNGYNKEDIELNRKAMYNKALDDFANTLKENYDYLPQIFSQEEFCRYVDEYAEQLKVGVED